MSSRLNTILAVILAIAILVAGGIFLVQQSGGDDDAPPVDSTPTPLDTTGTGTITAEGTISFVNPVGELILANPDGTEQTAIAGAAGVVDYRWAPGGNLIALATDLGGETQVSVIQAEGTHVFDVPDGTGFEWSTDGSRIAIVMPSGVVVFDAAGAELRRIENAVRPEWSPDGGTLAIVSLGADGQGTPVLVSVDTGDSIPLADGIPPAPPDYPILWHPAGAIIAYRDRLYEPAAGAQTELVGIAADWSPDGRLLLVTTGFDAGENATNGLLLDFTQGGKNIIGTYIRTDPEGSPPWLFWEKWMDWTPNSQYLFYLDPNPFNLRVRLYDTIAITQTPYENIKGQDPDLSPDSTHAVFSSDGGIWVMKLDASALREVAQGTLPQFRPASPAP